MSRLATALTLSLLAAPPAAAAWRTGGVVRAERQPPLATASGKVVHVRAAGAGLEVA